MQDPLSSTSTHSPFSPKLTKRPSSTSLPPEIATTSTTTTTNTHSTNYPNASNAGLTSPLIQQRRLDIEYNLSPPGSPTKSSVTGATLNFTNSIIGAGIIGLPYAVSQAGVFLSVILLILIAVLVDWTVLMLVKLTKLSGQSSYQSIMGTTFGSVGKTSITFFQLMFAFGAMIAYVIIIGDTLPAVFQSVFHTSPESWLFSRLGFILLSTLVLLPLSLINNIAALSTTSAISLGSIFLIVFAVIVSVGSVPESLLGTPAKQILWVGPAPFKAIGIIAFAFVCHHSTFLIYDSLELPTLDRFARVTHYATLISLVFSMILAYTGYFTFVDKTMGNVLNNFPSNHGLINLARFCFALNMLTTYPIECYVACHVLQDYFQWYHRKQWALGLVFLSIGIACFVPDVSLILQITGSFSASALAFILPPLLWLQLSSTLKWQCRACITFGVLVLIFSLFF